jgi:nitroreductase
LTNGMTMTNAVIECILSRSAAKYYDPAGTLSDDQIRELVRIGTTALSAWRSITRPLHRHSRRVPSRFITA